MLELDVAIEAACQPWAHQIELLRTIPGVGPKVAQVIIAETGGDMSKFPSAAHVASWAGLAPAIYESAGKRAPAGRGRGNKWLSAMLVEAAGSVGRMKGKNYLAVQHVRLTRRRGMSRAQITVAHSILIPAADASALAGEMFSELYTAHPTGDIEVALINTDLDILSGR